jgi:hypothetical protein
MTPTCPSLSDTPKIPPSFRRVAILQRELCEWSGRYRAPTYLETFRKGLDESLVASWVGLELDHNLT